jgi:hypothetical protein
LPQKNTKRDERWATDFTESTEWKRMTNREWTRINTKQAEPAPIGNGDFSQKQTKGTKGEFL